MVWRDGTRVSKGFWYANCFFLLAYSTGTQRFVLIDFIGGNLSQPLLLAADPTEALGAATKQYVDAAGGMVIVPPTSFVMTPDSVALTKGVITNVISPTPSVTLPSTGSKWALHVSYNGIVGHANLTNTTFELSAWVADNSGNRWAVAGWTQAQAADLVGAMGGSGISPVGYNPAATVQLNLQMVGVNDDGGCFKTEAPPGSGTFTGSYPPTSLIVTPMRIA